MDEKKRYVSVAGMFQESNVNHKLGFDDPDCGEPRQTELSDSIERVAVLLVRFQASEARHKCHAGSLVLFRRLEEDGVPRFTEPDVCDLNCFQSNVMHRVCQLSLFSRMQELFAIVQFFWMMQLYGAKRHPHRLYRYNRVRAYQDFCARPRH